MKLLNSTILITILTILADSKDEIIALGGLATIIVALVTSYLGVLKIIDWHKGRKKNEEL